MANGTGDEYEATWRRDAKLVLVPRVDPSIRRVDGRPLASKKVINVKMHKPTSLFQPKKRVRLGRHLAAKRIINTKPTNYLPIWNY